MSILSVTLRVNQIFYCQLSQVATSRLPISARGNFILACHYGMVLNKPLAKAESKAKRSFPPKEAFSAILFISEGENSIQS